MFLDHSRREIDVEKQPEAEMDIVAVEPHPQQLLQKWYQEDLCKHS